MLPAFDENGNLPPGTYESTIDEVIRKFEAPGYGQRRTISTKLKELFDLVSSYALGIYVDGSYTTSKIRPNDADVIIVLPDDFDVSSMDAHRLEQMRKKYVDRELDISYYRITADERRLQQKVLWYCHDDDLNPKGIIYGRIR